MSSITKTQEPAEDNCPQPCYAIFHGEGGYAGEQEKARNTFRVGGQYKIINGTMGQSSTRLVIEGYPGGWNSVLFHYDHTIAPVVFPYLKLNITDESLREPDTANATRCGKYGSEPESTEECCNTCFESRDTHKLHAPPLWRATYENVDGRLEFVKSPDLFVWACVDTRNGEVEMGMEIETDDSDLPDLVEGAEWRRFRLVEAPERRNT